MSRSGRGGDGGPYRMKPSSNRSASPRAARRQGITEEQEGQRLPEEIGAVPAATISGAGSASAGANPAASHSRARSSVRASALRRACSASSGGAATIAVGPPTAVPASHPRGRAGDRGRSAAASAEPGARTRASAAPGQAGRRDQALEHPVDPTGADHLGVQAGRGQPTRSDVRDRGRRLGAAHLGGPSIRQRARPGSTAQAGVSSPRADTVGDSAPASRALNGRAKAKRRRRRRRSRPVWSRPSRFPYGRADRPGPTARSRKGIVRRRFGEPPVRLPAPRSAGLFVRRRSHGSVRRSRIGAMAAYGCTTARSSPGRLARTDRRQRRPRSHAARGRTPLRSARRAGTGGVVDRQR